MNIKYKIENGQCKTKCPFGVKEDDSKIFVGSLACDYCEYKLKSYKRQNIIKCGYKKGVKKNGFCSNISNLLDD